MQWFSYSILFSLLFGVFIGMLPFSKGVAAAAYVLLIVLSFCKLILKNRFFQTPKIEQVSLSKVYSYKRKKILLAPLFLFLALTFSLLYTADQQTGIRLIISQSKMLGIPFIFFVNYDLLRQKKDDFLLLFLRAASLAALITCLFFLLPSKTVAAIAATIPPLKDYIIHKKAYAFGAYSPFLDRLQFSYLLSGSFFLALWRLLKLPTKSSRFSDYIYILAPCLCLLILGARGTQLGFILGGGMWLIGIYLYYGHPVLKAKISSFLSYSLLVLCLFLTTFCLPLLIYKKVPAVKMRYDQLRWEIATFQDNTFQNYEYIYFTSVRRFLSWRNSWLLIQEQPLLGVGIGDYEAKMATVYQQDALGYPVNTHSQLLYYWTCAGLLGIGLFLLVWGHWFYCLLRAKDYWTRILACSFFAFYTFVFLLDAPLNFQVGAMTFWFFYSFVGLLEHSKTPIGINVA